MRTNSARTLPRFLATDLDPAGAEVRLASDESHHLTRVLRLGIDDRVAVFDGRGVEFVARVVAADRGDVRLALEERVPVRMPRVPLTLVQAVLKGSSMDDVVRDATMMGAVTIQSLVTAHTAVKPAVALREENVLRWRRVAVASAKQARSATIPEVEPPITLAQLLSVPPASLMLFLVEPSAGRETRPMRTFVGEPAPGRVSLIVGPEGGWSADEIECAVKAGALLTSLGSLTLRAEAMALAAMAVATAIWE